MRIRSVGHACLEIESSGLRIVSDPWWAGPAYTRQWQPWPTPRPAGLDERAIDYLYLSHGHEDHLHVPTLRTLRRGATVLVPEFLAGSMGDFLRDELGFCDVLELRHGRTVTLRRGLKVTCYVNLSDSMLVIEDGDRVLVNANDALHASPPAVIDHFCRLLRSRHPAIDTLFVGFSGASWFPNCLRLPGKNDRAVARAREELFTDNFVRIAAELRPRVACAYAASFILADPALRWINDVKLEVAAPDVVFRRRHPSSGTRAHLLLPDDLLDGLEVIPGGTPRPSRETLDEALATTLRGAVEHASQLAPLPPDALRDLVARLDLRVQANAARLRRGAAFEVELRLRDNPGLAVRVTWDGRSAHAALGPPRRAAASLELRAEILEAALHDDCGLESIVIGYGAVATLEAPEQLARVYDLLHLLSPRQGSLHAVASELRRAPARSLGALWSQRWPLAFAMGTRLGLFAHPYELRGLASRPVAPPVAA